MPLFAETEEKIFGDVLFDIVNDTNITRASPGSKTRAIAGAMSRKMGRMWSQFDLNMVQAYLTGAEGRYLDLIGGMMGVNRLGEESAGVTSTERVLRFYVDVGTFGGVNSGNSIYIPAGAIISTEPNNNGIRYRTPFAVILPSDQEELFVAADALRPGTGSNIGSNQLVYHNFTDYAGALTNSLKVTNEAEIVTGNDIESDTNFRFRISNQILVGEAGNQTAVRLAALIVPGVADVIGIPYNRGVGSFDLLIKSTTPSVPVSLLNTVQEAVFKTTSWGMVATVRAPIEIGVSLSAVLTLRRKLSVTEEEEILSATGQNVTDYINNLDIAEDLIVNEIVERVLSTSDLIKNIGTAGKPLETLYIHRPSRLEDNKVRSTLLGDYTAEAEEKLLVEDRFAGATPIQIRTEL
jgi:uncharacterized phage protein gp47/JayE